MKENKTTIQQRLRSWWGLAPARHVLLLVSGALLAAYLLLRGSGGAMAAVSGSFVRPWHRWMSRLTAPLPFSLAEALIVLSALGALAYLVWTVIALVRRGDRGRRVYRFLLTCGTAGLLLYTLFCYFWGVYYYTSDFEDQSGIRGGPVATADLEAVTRYFSDLVNEYGALAERNEAGQARPDLDRVFARSKDLYAAVEQAVPCLSGDPVPAKRFFLSRCMSYVNFSGFFFPFTAEANINVDCPPALIPSTIGHELAHQRGVAQEDEANFVSVLACLSDGDPAYCYSACLLAYIHLGNALYEADYDAWLENYQRLSPGVRADLAESNEYWAQFKTPVSKVSDSVYTGFLHSYGQTLGLKTYGKCVDLLVAFYMDQTGQP